MTMNDLLDISIKTTSDNRWIITFEICNVPYCHVSRLCSLTQRIVGLTLLHHETFVCLAQQLLNQSLGGVDKRFSIQFDTLEELHTFSGTLCDAVDALPNGDARTRDAILNLLQQIEQLIS